MRKLSQYKKIKEEDHITFEQYSQLSYRDIGATGIDLYVNDVGVGNAPVWKDSEEEGREYITLNYEIVYLDTIAIKHQP